MLEGAAALATLKGLKQYKGDEAGLEHYLRRCIRNGIIGELRFLRQSNKRSVTEALDAHDPIGETAGFQELHEAVDKLSKPCREFCLCYMHYGCSVVAAGNALGLTAQQRTIRWRQVKEQIRNLLRRDE